MADFAAVLRKTIAALRENTPEARDRIYQKARSTIEAKLKAVSPPPSPEVIDRQMRLLEDAIKTVEAEYAPAAPEPEPEPEPENEFDKVLRDLEALSSAPSKARWSMAEKKPAGPIITRLDADEPESSDASALDEAPARDTSVTLKPDEPSVPEVSLEPENADEPDPSGSDNEAPVVSSPTSNEVPDQPDMAVVEPETENVGDRSEEEETSRETPSQSEQPDAATLDETFEDRPALQELRTKRAAQQKSRKVPLVAAAVLLLLAGGAVGAWFYRDDVARIAGYGTGTQDASTSGEEVAAAPVDVPERLQPETPATSAPQEPVRKLTQRLLPDGTEIDEGPASGQPTVGEGTSIAASTERPAEEARQSGEDAAIAVGQKAIFYEERTIQEQASASNGNVVWTVEQESPGADLPPEPVIYAEATIPEKRLRLKMSIRRNVDQSLPASYIAELIFLTPEDFSGGAVGSVASISLKRTEQDAGNRLLGVPAKIADGFFLVALSDNNADVEANNLLLERMEWIDIPIVYTSGRRALITLEKGVPGGSVFNQALSAWREATSG
jgi:hypothetical protein